MRAVALRRWALCILCCCIVGTVTTYGRQDKKIVRFQVNGPDKSTAQLTTRTGEMVVFRVESAGSFGFVPTASDKDAGLVSFEVFKLEGESRTSLTKVDVAVGKEVETKTTPIFKLRVLSVKAAELP